MTQQNQYQNGQQQGETVRQVFNETVLSELTGTDINTEPLEGLDVLFSKEDVLANLTNAELKEAVWDLRITENMFLWMHPPNESLVTGRFRAYVNDDPNDTLEPLSEQEKFRIRMAFRKARRRLTRSRGMKQQEVVRTEFKEHRRTDDTDESTGILGAISK